MLLAVLTALAVLAELVKLVELVDQLGLRARSGHGGFGLALGVVDRLWG